MPLLVEVGTRFDFRGNGLSLFLKRTGSMSLWSTMRGSGVEGEWVGVQLVRLNSVLEKRIVKDCWELSLRGVILAGNVEPYFSE